MISSGINLVMTVIGFSVSVMFIVFVCTRLICARIHYVSRRRAARSDPSSMERGLHGVEPLVVANFPMKKFKDLCLSSKENAQCTVCLADYHEEDTLRILPICGHFFHVTCIDIWLQQHFTCPVCRVSLCDLPKRKWFMQPMFSSAIRSQHRMMHSVNAHYGHCLANGQRYLSRSNNSQLDPIEEVPCQPDTGNVNIGHGDSVLNAGDDLNKGSPDKQVESPSNH